MTQWISISPPFPFPLPLSISISQVRFHNSSNPLFPPDSSPFAAILYHVCVSWFLRSSPSMPLSIPMHLLIPMIFRLLFLLLTYFLDIPSSFFFPSLPPISFSLPLILPSVSSSAFFLPELWWCFVPVIAHPPIIELMTDRPLGWWTTGGFIDFRAPITVHTPHDQPQRGLLSTHYRPHATRSTTTRASHHPLPSTRHTVNHNEGFPAPITIYSSRRNWQLSLWYYFHRGSHYGNTYIDNRATTLLM